MMDKDLVLNKHPLLEDENVIMLLRTLTFDPCYKYDSKTQAELDVLVKQTKMDYCYSKAFTRKFSSQARTLSKTVIGYNENKYYGNFTIYAYEHEDYYRWVNFFICIYDTGEWVLGDFQKIVFASNQETYKAFKNSVDVKEWDYQDI